MTSPMPSLIQEMGRLIQTLNQIIVKLETSRRLTLPEHQSLKLLHKAVFNYDDDFKRMFIRILV